MKVNGAEWNYPGAVTVAEFMKKQGYSDKAAVVEINGAIVSRQNWDSRVLEQEDKIEIVTFVGGG